MKKKSAVLAVIILIVTVCFFGCGLVYELASNKMREPAGFEASEPRFSVTMLDVGEGLCLLFSCDGSYMIYDGGGRETSSRVVSYLKSLGVDEIELMIASHYDEDHIGGLIGVLNTATVKTFIGPDYVPDTDIYRSLFKAVSAQETEVVYPAAGDVFSFGGASVNIKLADSSFENENDRSLVAEVSFGDITVLLPGDAEAAAEAAMLAEGSVEPVDILVVAHHGAASSSGEAFLGAASPAYAFLSVGKGNEYSHPAGRTMESLAACGAKLFRTDLQGDVTAMSDGKSLWFSVEATGDFRNGSEMSIGRTGEEEESSPQDYVLNTRSRKFHYPECDSVSAMSDRNKKEVFMSREEIIRQGYESCGSCNP